MKQEPRDYQHTQLDDIDIEIEKGHRNILSCADCGTGKGSLTVFLGQQVKDVDLKLGIVLPREPLLEQQANRFFAAGLPEESCTILAGGRRFDPDRPIWICSQQTLSRRMAWLRELPDDLKRDVWILDEAHESSWSKPGLFILSEESGSKVNIGFTATPFNLSKTRNLKQLYTSITSIPLTKPELNALGYTTPVKFHVMTKDAGKPQLDGIKVQAGEWKNSDLAVACDKPSLIEHLLDENERITGGEKRTISFAVNLAHAESLHNAVLRRGKTSALITGSTPSAERRAMYRDFENGSLLYLNSCEVLTVGFDCPAAEVALAARPTLSKALWYQLCGRVGRPSPATGKTCGYVLDQAGNSLRLDVPETRVGPYQFEADKQTKGPGKGKPALKACPDCGLIQSNFRTECEGCGYQFPKAEKITTGSEMVELDVANRIRKLEMTREKKLQGWLKKAMRNGYSPQWACVQFRDTYGGWPDKSMLLHRLFPTPTKKDATEHLLYLAGVAKKKGLDRLWIGNQFQLEFGTSFWMDDVIKDDPMLSVLPCFLPAQTGILAAIRSS